MIDPNVIDIKVSVIIPVYKAEKYIRKCCETLFGQTLNEIEYIFIDDCSPDDSIKIIKDVLKNYPEKRDWVEFITHDVNLGVSQSRQDGVDKASGKYIIHCDPDDWIELDMYENMFGLANETEAEVVVCDYVVEDCGLQIVKPQMVSQDKHEILQSINKGAIHAALWNKMIKREYWQALNFRFDKDISLWEDMSVVVPLLLSASKIEKINLPLYHYRWGDSETLSYFVYTAEKVSSMIRASEFIKGFLIKNKLFKEYKKEFLDLNLRATNGLVTRISCLNPELWRLKNDVSIFEIIKSNLWWTHKLLCVFAKLKLDALIGRIVKLKSIKRPIPDK